MTKQAPPIPDGHRELEKNEWVRLTDLCFRRNVGPWTAVSDLETSSLPPYRYDKGGVHFVHIRPLTEPYDLDPVHFRALGEEPGLYYIRLRRNDELKSGPYQSEEEAISAIEAQANIQPMWDYGPWGGLDWYIHKA